MTDNVLFLSATELVTRETYVKPAIVQELKLETRAGSPKSPGPDRSAGR